MVLVVNGVLKKADDLFAAGRKSDALRLLRRLSIRQYGELMLRVPDRFEALKAALPEMPSDRIQREWTGNSGRVLLRQTCRFVQSLQAAFVIRGRSLEDRSILDYGCGWGRITRLMYRYSEPVNIYGVDASDEAVQICRATRVLGNIAQCDYVPRELPFTGVTFDLVYAFSVFTHLSEKTGRAVLAAIRRRIADDGLLVLTVRPVEYWGVHSWFPPGVSATTLRKRHMEEGFAFIPHHREAIEGDITFGEASIALDYVRHNWHEWELLGSEINRVDRYQAILFLRPQ